jgi:tetratricopeptide (TPR) repeat protein
MSEHPFDDLPLPDDTLPSEDHSLGDLPAATPDDTLAQEMMDTVSLPAIHEPPVDAADTKPKAPPGLRQTGAADTQSAQLAAAEPPIDSLADTAEMVIRARRSAAHPLLLVMVMLSAVCLCLALVSMAGYAGYRDGLATNDVQITQTLATGIAEQYAAGVSDLQNGNPELAKARFAWIVQTIQPAPAYLRDSVQMLAMASTMSAYTPTPTVAPSPTPAPILTAPAVSVTPQGPDPAALYDQASSAMIVAHYEEAIEWLESLQAIAPTYRAQEAQAMYLEALTEQGKIYLRGLNEDGEDRLARGVLLIYRADAIGEVDPPGLLYEAQVAERYLNARYYINGGNTSAALPILEQLCSESETTCDWSYRGVSIRDLLEQAQSGTNGTTP